MALLYIANVRVTLGVGAIFSAALISSEPGRTGVSGNLLAVSPEDPMQNALWPVVTFVVLCSSIVHGSSIPLFRAFSKLNTLTITMSYSVGHEDGPSWMNRLPKISSVSKSMGKESLDLNDIALDTLEYPPGTLPPVGFSGNFLRRQREEENDAGSHKGREVRRRRKALPGVRLQGLDLESEVRPHQQSSFDASGLGNSVTVSDSQFRHVDTDTYVEENNLTTENDDGNVPISPKVGQNEIVRAEPPSTYQSLRKRLAFWAHKDGLSPVGSKEETKGLNLAERSRTRKRGPALAYQFGNTIIIEDENGEVVKTYDLPQKQLSSATPVDKGNNTPNDTNDEDDRRIRFTIGGAGPKLTKDDFLKEIQKLDPRARIEARKQESVHPAPIKKEEETDDTGRLRAPALSSSSGHETETPAERRRREAALGLFPSSVTSDDDYDSSEPSQSDQENADTSSIHEEQDPRSHSVNSHVEFHDNPSSTGSDLQPRTVKSPLKMPAPKVVVTVPDDEIANPAYYMSGALQGSPNTRQTERSRSPKGKERRVSFE